MKSHYRQSSSKSPKQQPSKGPGRLAGKFRHQDRGIRAGRARMA